jgi:glycosyltransferase involved in cell wall biosynthesis
MDWGFAVSKSVRDFMVVQRHMPQDRIEVLYNGAPLQEFQPASPAATAAERRKWGIAEDCVVLGAVGRLDQQKGNTYLLKALPRLIAKDRRLKVMIVADGPLADPLRAEIAALGIQEHVILAGYQENIPLIQSLFDIQVFPSLYEGTPLTMFEAMSMGVAIVSTNVDGLGEVLTDGRNALAVPPMDAHALSIALEDLIVHRERRAALAAAARQDSRIYDAQRMVDRMQTVYRDLLQSPRRF